ncbi:type II toxin-antitoxin system RelE/ParE family toxin [Sphingorhabdus sp. IMCC26285]|uniref:Type II toxin-antitoxin system RelE/ParE family toxin n=1 Tax=Sphingorhabdus profundilacus TaxID=2509718 RepID=A0A6I4LVL0_9SPHN|nr:type II toxin-antitoxin system RelE/ParE family toxin [Sphingorhabdus profundilacus]
MLKLIWRASAIADLEVILSFISDHDWAAANNLLLAVETCAERLPDHPYLYRAGRVAGTREAVVHPNYIIIYRVSTDTVEIVNIVHARQQYP